MLLVGLALLEQHGRAENGSDNTEGGERDKSNHQDGHKSLLIAFWNRGCPRAVMMVTHDCEVRIPIPVEELGSIQTLGAPEGIKAGTFKKHADEPDVTKHNLKEKARNAHCSGGFGICWTGHGSLFRRSGS